MARARSIDGATELVPVPVSSLNWKFVEDHVLNTPLGEDECRVEVLDSEAYRVLKPGEDARIRKAQARLFCEWVIQTRGVILGAQLKYLISLFGLSQKILADAAQVSASAISQLISGKSGPSNQTSRELAVFFRLESVHPGFLAALAQDRFVDSVGSTEAA